MSSSSGVQGRSSTLSLLAPPPAPPGVPGVKDSSEAGAVEFARAEALAEADEVDGDPAATAAPPNDPEVLLFKPASLALRFLLPPPLPPPFLAELTGVEAPSGAPGPPDCPAPPGCPAPEEEEVDGAPWIWIAFPVGMVPVALGGGWVV